MDSKKLQVDEWIWGTETIIWGFDASHKYTFKILAPKKGRAGCLSLQYHHEKSESWFQFAGTAWILVVVEGQVCTRIMRVGDIQNLETGTIHRLMAVDDDCKVIEPSTPDKHAADKSIVKDVVRLHCVLGRAASAPRTPQEAEIVAVAIKYTEEACDAIERGELPVEHQSELLIGKGAFKL